MERIDNFKKAHERFSDAVKYISDNEVKLNKDPERLKKIFDNFNNKFEQPLDTAWEALNEEEKKRFKSLYIHRRATQDEFVKKVIEMFDGRIV